jgi:hypothetical protein
MAADHPDRDDEAPATPDRDTGTGRMEPDPGRPGHSEREGASSTDSAGAPGGQTREQPALDDSGRPREGGAGDPWAETQIRPGSPESSGVDRAGPGSTGVLPPVEDAPETPRWTARASVRSPDVVEDEHDWAEPPRGLLVPTLIALLVVLLIVLFGVGTWLIFANRPSGTTPATTPTVQSATPPATTEPPAPTTTPPPTPVPLPDLRGKEYEAAAAELSKLGFTPVRRDEISSEVDKGKVVGTDPPAGTPVVPGPNVRINIIVSLGLPDSTPVDPSGSTPPN